MTFGYAAGQLGTKLDLDIEDAAWQLIHGLEKVRATPEVTLILPCLLHILTPLIYLALINMESNAIALLSLSSILSEALSLKRFVVCALGPLARGQPPIAAVD